MFDFAKIEQSNDCISGFDENLNLVIWNGAVERKYQMPKADVLGRNLLELFPQIVNDFRVTCFRESIADRKSFFFSSLPYQYDHWGIYTQLIIPAKHPLPGNIKVLSIVRDHSEHERYMRNDLLQPLMGE
ncbi:MAG: PAS domain-containing protein [Bacteroidetes bacterium]|nr:PAS domain-containing protein [Bacteroidota bacterium]